MQAASNIVSVVNYNTVIFHYHNQFDRHYNKFRYDIDNDRKYIIKNIFHIKYNY